MDKNLVLSNLNESTTNFLNIVNDFPEEHFNIKPSSDSWSAAEIIQHIEKIEYLLNTILEGNKKPVEERKPDKKIEIIKTAFQNQDKKYTAYGPILPDSNSKDKDVSIIKFEKNRIKLKEIVKSEDLTLVCQDFEHGVFGDLTIFEWIYFVIYHCERHGKQIQNIKFD